VPEYLGNIEVPAIVPIGTFPLELQYGSSVIIPPQIVRHLVDNGEQKVEQRFVLGNGAKQFNVKVEKITYWQRIALRDFWEARSGAYGAFTLNWPNSNLNGTTPYTVRFGDPGLTFEWLSNFICSSGVRLIEIPSNALAYTSAKVVNRFPDAALKVALTDQVQELIPLVRVKPKTAGYPTINMSDRRVTIDGTLYQPRLLDWDPIQQNIEGGADQVAFTFGNADRVMSLLANDVDLVRSIFEFSLFHVNTNTKIDLWAGEVVGWSADKGPQFIIQATDGVYDLRLNYPCRTVNRTCWKLYADGKGCPWTPAIGTTTFKIVNGKEYNFVPSESECDHGFDTKNGCMAHKMDNYYGGVSCLPQAVRTKDNSTGTWGMGRATLTSSSMIDDSVYGKPIPEIYTDTDIPVNAMLISGRDEGDFYSGLGIVGEGPILEWTPGPTQLLDGNPNHGPGNYGLRLVNGDDPNTQPFNLGAGSPQVYDAERAAGLAFAEIRRSDAKGLQISKLAEHVMQVSVRRGLAGRIWTAPGVCTTGCLTNPVWIAVNAYLKARGYRFASVAECEQIVDIQAAIEAAAICDQWVDTLIGTGQEQQFKFIGIIGDAKPLRQWLDEILNTCLGYYTFRFNKLRIGIRSSATSLEGYGPGNIIVGSMVFAPKQPEFNDLTIRFGDPDYQLLQNIVNVDDKTHKQHIGGSTTPVSLPGEMTLAGVASKSVAGRIASVRVREAVGGVNPTEYRKARSISFKTTILGLSSEPGQVQSIVDQDLPDGAMKMRCKSWKLFSDMSVAISGETVTDSMYDIISTPGPKLSDVWVDPVLPPEGFPPDDFEYRLETIGDGFLRIKDFACKTNALSVDKAYFSIYYVDETQLPSMYSTLDVDADDTTFHYYGTPPVADQYLLIDTEIVLVKSVTKTDDNHGSFEAVRGQLGTTAAAHGRQTTTVSAIVDNQEFTVGTGKTLYAGLGLVNNSGESIPISSYAPLSGNIFTTLPFAALTVGESVYADPRIYPLQLRNECVSLPPRFFKSDKRYAYQNDINMPFAGIVAVVGNLENTRGERSPDVTKHYMPLRLRTGGGSGYRFDHPAAPAGVTEDAFMPLYVLRDQAFVEAYAEFSGGASDPIPTPAAPSMLTPRDLGYSGYVKVTGTADGLQLSVTVGNLTIPTITYSGNDDAAQAIWLRDWLNGGDEFAAAYSADIDGTDNTKVNIRDKFSLGGQVSAVGSPELTIDYAGFTNYLGITRGRRYACAFYSHSANAISALGPASESTGATGGSQAIDIRNLPNTGDTRVTAVLIYATPDGGDGSVWKKVGEISPGAAYFTDSVTEAALASQPTWNGPVQTESSGAMKVTVRQNGVKWFQLKISSNSNRSQSIPGEALGSAAKGASITADLNNGKEVARLAVMLI
jgi:hypothetical protein